MEFLELVKRRRSIRKYSSRPIPRDVIDGCLEAARLAPSACNSQPWYFIVADDEKTRNELSQKAFSGIYSINSFAKNAPVLIIVVTKRPAYPTRLGSLFRGTQFSLIDVGIACEHLILQAEEKGIGTCWLGWFNEREIKRHLGVSKKEKIDIIISMGYALEDPREQRSRKSLEEMRRFNAQAEL